MLIKMSVIKLNDIVINVNVNTAVSISMSMSMVYLNGHQPSVSLLFDTSYFETVHDNVTKRAFFFKYSQRRKLRFIQRGERTDQDVRAPHGTACGGLGWVRNCTSLMLAPSSTNQPTTNTDPHQPLGRVGKVV